MITDSSIASAPTALNSYRYRALNTEGHTITGTLTARSEQAAAAALSDQLLFPITVQLRSPLLARKRSLPLTDLALGLRVLANLLESGLSIGKTLGAFAELAPVSWAPGIEPVQYAVRDGKTLSAALAASPLDIPPVVLGILHAGEMGMGLGSAVRRAAELIERMAATRASVRNALAYPMVLAVAGSLSLSLLIGVVLPKFAAILTDLGQTLPRTTQVVLNTSAAVRAAALPLLGIIAILCVAWSAWTRTTAGRLAWHRTLRAFPMIGAVRRSGATSRIAAAMASLLESGVPVAPALVHAAAASGDAAAAHAVLEARERIVHGERTSRAMEATDALTPTTVRLLRAGEESGRLATMFAHAAIIEQERAEQTVRSAVRLLEPGLILVFGGVVAFVAAALLQAVYSVRPTG